MNYKLRGKVQKSKFEEYVRKQEEKLANAEKFITEFREDKLKNFLYYRQPDFFKLWVEYSMWEYYKKECKARGTKISTEQELKRQRLQTALANSKIVIDGKYLELHDFVEQYSFDVEVTSHEYYPSLPLNTLKMLVFTGMDGHYAEGAYLEKVVGETVLNECGFETRQDVEHELFQVEIIVSNMIEKRTIDLMTEEQLREKIYIQKIKPLEDEIENLLRQFEGQELLPATKESLITKKAELESKIQEFRSMSSEQMRKTLYGLKQDYDKQLADKKRVDALAETHQARKDKISELTREDDVIYGSMMESGRAKTAMEIANLKKEKHEICLADFERLQSTLNDLEVTLTEVRGINGQLYTKEAEVQTRKVECDKKKQALEEKKAEKVGLFGRRAHDEAVAQLEKELADLQAQYDSVVAEKTRLLTERTNKLTELGARINEGVLLTGIESPEVQQLIQWYMGNIPNLSKNDIFEVSQLDGKGNKADLFEFKNQLDKYIKTISPQIRAKIAGLQATIASAQSSIMNPEQIEEQQARRAAIHKEKGELAPDIEWYEKNKGIIRPGSEQYFEYMELASSLADDEMESRRSK